MREYYRDKVEKAFDYAMDRNSFRKTDLIARADHVCVFGLGKYFDDAFIKQDVQKRFRVSYLCDNNVQKLELLKSSELYTGIKGFITPDELKTLKNVVVIIMLGDPRSAIEQLKHIVGLENCITYNDLVLDEVMAGGGPSRTKLLEAFDLLTDELSQKTFADIFCLRVAPHLSDSTYEELYRPNQYFAEDVFDLSDDECLVDCGAFIGDTLEEFYEITHGKFQHYYAFEMDMDNFDVLQKKAKELDHEKGRIKCFNCGVWHEDTELHYGKMSSEDSYSIFNPRETEEVKAIRLDSVLADKRVSLMKMDIEGAEMSALMGAECIIKTQQPKMAICVYHKLEDLWEIPLFLKEKCPNYHIYIRHHAKWWVSETVCYAVVE